MTQTQTRRPTPADIKKEVREAVEEVLKEQHQPVPAMPTVKIPETEAGRAAYNVALFNTQAEFYKVLTELANAIGDATTFEELYQAWADLEPRMVEMDKTIRAELAEIPQETTS